MKMTKHTKVFLLAALSATLLGCSRESVVSAPSKAVDSFGSAVAEADLRGPIRFSISSDTKTVTEVTAATLQANGFKVCCAAGSDATVFATLSEYFNETASYDAEAGTFGTSSPYYFTESDQLLFFAANADVDIYFKHENWPLSATFEVSGPWEKDVVTAEASFDPGSDSRSAVNLAFAHRLAQMSVAAKGAVSGVSYEVTGVSIHTKTWARWYYILAADPDDWQTNYWQFGDEFYDYSHFSGAASCGASSYSAVGSRFAYFPGTWTVTVDYRVKSGSVVLGTYSKTFDATLTQGKRTQYNLTLPYDDNDEMVYSVTVADWVDESYDISL